MSAGVSIVRMHAGDVAFGVNARCVLALRRATDAPHLTSVLGLAPSGNQRAPVSISVLADDAAADIAVDGPVGIVKLRRQDILPMTVSVETIAWTGIVGFAVLDGTLVQLLDPLALIDRAVRTGARTSG